MSSFYDRLICFIGVSTVSVHNSFNSGLSWVSTLPSTIIKHWHPELQDPGSIHGPEWPGHSLDRPWAWHGPGSQRSTLTHWHQGLRQRRQGPRLVWCCIVQCLHQFLVLILIRDRELVFKDSRFCWKPQPNSEFPNFDLSFKMDGIWSSD